VEIVAESEFCIKTHVGPGNFERFRLENPRPPVASTDLKDITGKILIENWPNRLCQQCRPQAERLINEEREKVWNDMPSFFDLPKWETLRGSLK